MRFKFEPIELWRNAEQFEQCAYQWIDCKWEIGEKRPSGPSLKLPHVIERKGVNALD